MYELFTAVFFFFLFFLFFLLFCFSAFLFTVACPHFLFFFQNASCDDTRLLGVGLIHGRHSERHFGFGSSVVLYDSEFRACWRWDGSFDLFNSPLVTSWFSVFNSFSV